MSGEAELVGMEAETVLEQDITVKMSDKVIMVVKGLQSLPITQRAEINRAENETDLQIIYEYRIYTKKLSKSNIFTLEVTVDTNSIITATFHDRQ
uniref:Uncharacterized protein n=1 Tax=Panagrolaimus sp. PS1159 TaxID=55785 RepID=A0AC35FZD1_9BILA